MFLTCSSNFKLLQNVIPRSLADTHYCHFYY